MKLYELTGEITHAIELYNSVETDERLIEVEQKLFALQIPFKEKCVSVAHHIINLESEAGQIDLEIARLVELKKRREKQSEWFRGYLKSAMEATNTLEVDAVTVKLKICKNPASVVVEDETQVPKEYKREKTIVEINKNAIKESWANKVGVAGTKVVNTTRLQIK